MGAGAITDPRQQPRSEPSVSHTGRSVFFVTKRRRSHPPLKVAAFGSAHGRTQPAKLLYSAQRSPRAHVIAPVLADDRLNSGVCPVVNARGPSPLGHKGLDELAPLALAALTLRWGL